MCDKLLTLPVHLNLVVSSSVSNMKLIASLLLFEIVIFVSSQKLHDEKYEKAKKQMDYIAKKWPFSSKCLQDTKPVEPEKCLQNIRNESYHQVLLGVLIENYSRYQFLHPTNHTEYEGYNTVIEPAKPIIEGSSGLFVVDNGANNGYDARGSMSWQLKFQNNVPVNQRLVVTYNVPYR